MRKFTIVVLVLCFFLMGCFVDPPKPEPEKPILANAAIQAGVDAGSISILIAAKDKDAMVYYIVVDQSAAQPTFAQVKAGVSYGDVTIHKAAAVKDTIYEDVILEGGKIYKVYYMLELNGVFSELIYSNEVLTKTEEEVIDRGKGTEEEPFRIETVADLEEMLTGELFVRDAHYKLMNDLDLKVAGYGEGAKSWIPIGKQTGALVKFAGVFDGNNHTIANLYINNSATEEKTGLFAELEATGVIQNLTLTNTHITTLGTRIGAVVGYSKGTVAYVSVIGGKITGKPSGDADVGGVVGYQYQSGVIRYVYSDIEVTAGGRRIAGIVGVADVAEGDTAPIIISDSYSVGNVIGTSIDARQAGGIVGYARGMVIERCYSSGDITGSRETGGLVGFVEQRLNNTIVPVIRNSFYMGARVTIFDEANKQVSNMIGNFKIANGTPITDKLYGSLTTEIVGGPSSTSSYIAEGINIDHFKDVAWLRDTLGWNTDSIWEVKENALRPTLRGTTDDGHYTIPTVPLNINRTELKEGKNPGEIDLVIETNLESDIFYIVVLNTDSMPTNEQIMAGVNYGDVTLVAFGSITAGVKIERTLTGLEEGQEYVIYVVAKNDTEELIKNGMGKPKLSAPAWGGEDPAILGYYPIYLPSDLEKFGVVVATTKNAKAKLMNDIDFEGYYGEGSAGFAPIPEFKGLFDGQNYTIKNLYINLPGTTNVGLFAKTAIDANLANKAEIMNLNIDGANVTGANYVGILVGDSKSFITNVTITNSTVTATNLTDSRVGGLVGRHNAGSINYVELDVTVDGGKYVGGIVGHIDYPADNTATEIVVSNVIVRGTVSGVEQVGGVIGYLRATLNNAISYTTVTRKSGTATSFGAICGYIQSRHASSPHKVSLTSVISYTDIKAIGTANNDRGLGLVEKIYVIGTTEDANHTLVTLEAITAEWLTSNTNFDMVDVFVLKVDGTLAFK